MLLQARRIGNRALFLLSLAAGPSLIGLYFAFSFASQLGRQVGRSELETLALLACVSALAVPLLSPLGIFVAPRKLAAAAMLVAATTHLLTPVAPPHVAWLLQIAAAAAVFAPWPVAAMLAETPGWSTNKGILWWLGGYAVMAGGLAAPSLLPELESLHTLQTMQLIWSAALALCALVVARCCPSGLLPRPDRWWKAWVGGLPSPWAIRASVVCGFALTPFDGLLQFAMAAADLTRGQYLVTNAVVILGLVGFWIARSHRARGAGAAQIAALIVVLAGVLGAIAAAQRSWGQFALSRTAMEFATSWLTAITQADPRTAAVAQLFKQTGAIGGILTGAVAWDRYAWLGVSVLVVLAGLVAAGPWGFVARRFRSVPTADELNRTWARGFDANAEHLDGRAVLAHGVPDFYLTVQRFGLPPLRRALARSTGVSVLDLLGCDLPQIALALARVFADPTGVVVVAEDGVLVMTIGRKLVIRVARGAEVSVERSGRRPRITAPIALVTATWCVPVEDLDGEAERHALLGRRLRERLDTNRRRRVDPLTLVPVLGRLLSSPAIESEDLFDALALDKVTSWPVLEACTKAQLGCILATGAAVVARQHQPWLLVTLPDGTEAFVLENGRMPNRPPGGARKPGHRASRSERRVDGMILPPPRKVEVTLHAGDDACVQAVLDAMGDDWRETLFRGGAPDGIVAVAAVGDEDVGMAVLEQDANGARVVRSLWVRPDWLGRGVERKLLDALSKLSKREYGVAAELPEHYARIWAPTQPTSVSPEHQPVPA